MGGNIEAAPGACAAGYRGRFRVLAGLEVVPQFRVVDATASAAVDGTALPRSRGAPLRDCPPVDPRTGWPECELEFEDDFEDDALDESHWIARYLPQWSSRERSAARYEITGGCLRLLIEEGQQPWCPEFDGDVRVSSLQTGVFAGPVDSAIGQHRFTPQALVREAQQNVRLYTPQYGFFEIRARAIDDPLSMVALWMIGYEDEPERSAEICICEIFGRDVASAHTAVGMGVHPFGDRRIVDEFSREILPIDAREFHVYAAEWTTEQVAFFVDGDHVKTVHQSPSYPMQLMLGIYEFRGDADAGRSGVYPKRFTVDYVRGYRRADELADASPQGRRAGERGTRRPPARA